MVLLIPFVAACELETSSPQGISKTENEQSSPDRALINDCVEFTQLAAFLGNDDYAPLWDDTGHDVDVLRKRCEEMSIETLLDISDEREATEAFLEAAASPQPVPATEPASQAIQPMANLGAASCHPSYTGACVPIASDVDCAGGTGNGPAYVVGPVSVPGEDPYGLDDNGDGIGCEPKP